MALDARIQVVILLLWTLPTSGAPMDKPVTYSTLEEVPQGTLLGNIVDDAKLDVRYDGEEPSEVTLRLLNDSIGVHHVFAVDDGGSLTTQGRLDREVFCSHEEDCILTLDIELGPQKYFRIIKVNIDIQDINDNAPEFPDEVTLRSLPESSNPGTLLSLPLANDPDSPRYSVREYHLLTDTDKFRLKAFDAGGTVEEIYLEIIGKLDREQIDSYELQIQALDGGSPARNGSLIVNVTVTDINDNRAAFTQQTYTVSVGENTPRNTAILKVDATDADSGANGDILYRFSHRTWRLYGDVFHIDEATGSIHNTKELDYESSKKYTLTVTAEDRGVNAVASEATVVINVEDVNDNAPSIVVNPVREVNGRAGLVENSPSGTPVLHVSVTDPDEGQDVVCLVNSTEFTLKQMYKTDYVVVASSVFDRETTSSVNLKIECVDDGEPSLSRSETVFIEISDVNDNAPIFNQGVYFFSITRDTPVTTTVGEVLALDLDLGDNSKLGYKFANEAIDNIFEVDHTTGEIKTRISFAQESFDALPFEVVVTDYGSPARSSVSTVQVLMKEQLAQPHVISLGISENQPANIKVVDLAEAVQSLSTRRFEANTRIAKFHTLSGDVHDFYLDPTSGTLFTSATFDRESKSQYELLVFLVTEDGGVTFSYLDISVTDINDNSPIISYPSSTQSKLVLSDAVELGQTIAEVVAEDQDSGENARLTYAINSRYSADFDISASDGTVSLSRNADLSALRRAEEIMLQIVVSDQGSPTLSSTTILNVVFNGSQVWSMADLNQKGARPMDDLVTILAVVIPCACVVVVVIILIVVLLRGRICQTTTEPHWKCTTATHATNIEKHVPLDGILPTQNNPDHNDQQNKHAVDIVDVHDGEKKTDVDIDLPSKLRSLGLYPTQYSSSPENLAAVARDKDSDSGCSADMSNGTADSWTCGGPPSLRDSPELYPEASFSNRGSPQTYPEAPSPATGGQCSSPQPQSFSGSSDRDSGWGSDELPLATIAEEHRRILEIMQRNSNYSVKRLATTNGQPDSASCGIWTSDPSRLMKNASYSPGGARCTTTADDSNKCPGNQEQTHTGDMNLPSHVDVPFPTCEKECSDKDYVYVLPCRPLDPSAGPAKNDRRTPTGGIQSKPWYTEDQISYCGNQSDSPHPIPPSIDSDLNRDNIVNDIEKNSLASKKKRVFYEVQV